MIGGGGFAVMCCVHESAPEVYVTLVVPDVDTVTVCESICAGAVPAQVSVSVAEYVPISVQALGLRSTVASGGQVRRGQLLFTCTVKVHVLDGLHPL
jgi:hypothetical protein